MFYLFNRFLWTLPDFRHRLLVLLGHKMHRINNIQMGTSKRVFYRVKWLRNLVERNRRTRSMNFCARLARVSSLSPLCMKDTLGYFVDTCWQE